MIAPNLDNIPFFLTSQDRWILWREVECNGTKTKEPRTAANRLASSTNPETWSPFPAIADILRSRPSLFNGVGITLGDLGQGEHACGIDLDSCLDEHGDLAEWAQPIVTALRSFIEVSPSETGLKCFFRAKAEDARAVRDAFSIKPSKWGCKRSVTSAANGQEHGPAIEVYLGPGRYFTCTGKHWPSSPEDVTLLDRNALLQLAALVRQATGTSDGKKRSSPPGRDNSRSAAAFRLGAGLRRQGATFEEICEAIRTHPDTAEWHAEKGVANGGRELRNIWENSKRASQPPNNILVLVWEIDTIPSWADTLRFNLLTENCEVRSPFPPPQDGAKGPLRPLRDPQDLLAATLYFQANGFPETSKHLVWDALVAVAHRSAYHPVRDYLNGLQWDGIERVGSLFQRYFNAELPDENRLQERDRQVAYLEHISIGFMVGAVARVMDPGCKVDHVPVVVGQQSLLKSTAVRALCPDPSWFSDDISPNLIERDTKESLAGKWIIELAEIPHIRRETERVKAFFSRCADRYRSAYGRANQDHPRQCVFIGTSNDLEFVDVTGNRRFWPFRVAGLIDTAAIAADRDQIWAEATALYRRGVKWWLHPNIEKIAAEQQAGFVETDIWEDLIAKWVADHPGPFTMGHLFAVNTGITPYREIASVSRADEMRAARCLKKLGFRQSRQTIRGERGSWWERK